MRRIYVTRSHLRSVPPASPQLPPDFSKRLKPLLLSPHSHDVLTPRLEPSHSLPYPDRQPGPISPHGTERLDAPEAVNSYDHFLTKARLLLESEFRSQPSSQIRELEESLENRLYTVRFTWSGGAQESVFLTGSFNGWGAPIAMHKRCTSEQETVWECVVRLSTGEYRYKYVVDGELRVDGERLCEYVGFVPVANKLIIEEAERIG
ncbi:Homeobox protein SIX4 [Gracilaria domingensis]|nr:Homeobox protein SIX4 [Gracilaria domingensis]